MSDFEALYIGRKCGRGMGIGYILSAFMPLLIIILISLVVSFALVFISSITAQMDRMLQLLGTGTIEASARPELPEGAEIALTCDTEGLIYSESSAAAAYVKGVEEGYFSGMRGKELKAELSDEAYLNPAVASSSLAEELGLSIGDRMTILVMDGSGRARPVLLTLGGIFPSVYPQLDSRLIYIPLEFADGMNRWEILLPEDADARSVLASIEAQDISARGYWESYRSVYENIRVSMRAMYLVLGAVAVLAAFFSSDIAEAYTSRDMEDIRAIAILGAGKGRIRRIYLLIAMIAVAAASAIGMLLGIALGFLSPALIRLVASSDPSLLAYYVTSFDVVIPLRSLALMLLSMLAVSAISVRIFLRRLVVS